MIIFRELQIHNLWGPLGPTLLDKGHPYRSVIFSAHSEKPISVHSLNKMKEQPKSHWIEVHFYQKRPTHIWTQEVISLLSVSLPSFPLSTVPPYFSTTVNIPEHHHLITPARTPQSAISSRVVFSHFFTEVAEVVLAVLWTKGWCNLICMRSQRVQVAVCLVKHW